MHTILINGSIVVNTDNTEDAQRLLAQGYRVLTAEEISVAGMSGYEHEVCPQTTTVNADGSITFVVPIITSAQKMESLRATRDARLSATDKYLLPDYPISADTLAQIKAYRAALRDLPDQPGAPWPNQDVPWPIKPNV